MRTSTHHHYHHQKTRLDGPVFLLSGHPPALKNIGVFVVVDPSRLRSPWAPNTTPASKLLDLGSLQRSSENEDSKGGKKRSSPPLGPQGSGGWCELMSLGTLLPASLHRTANSSYAAATGSFFLLFSVKFFSWSPKVVVPPRAVGKRHTEKRHTRHEPPIHAKLRKKPRTVSIKAQMRHMCGFWPSRGRGKKGKCTSSHKLLQGTCFLRGGGGI